MGNVRHYDDGCQGPALTGAREMSLGASGLHAADLGDVHAILVCVAVHPGAGVRGILGVHLEADQLAAYLFYDDIIAWQVLCPSHVNNRIGTHVVVLEKGRAWSLVKLYPSRMSYPNKPAMAGR